MRVLVVNPPWETDRGYGIRSNSRWPHIRPDKHLQFPIFLAYTASCLEAEKHQVKVLDAVAEEMNTASFVAAVEAFVPDLVFIETATPSFEQDIQNAMAVKKQGFPVYLFGTHISAFYRNLIPQHKVIDGWIRGEYEFIIRDIARGLPKDQIKGLAYWDNGNNRLQENLPADNIKNLDDLPFPSRHLFNLQHYQIHLDPQPSALLVASRGCPYQCTYCIWPQQMNGHTHRMRSPKNICDELEQLIRDEGIIFFRFDDDIFSLNAEPVIAFCEEFIARGLNKRLGWTCFGHVNSRSEKMYEMMAKANCRRIDFGIESGSERILKAIKKNISIEKAKGTFDLCKKYGIRTYGDFMIGFPHETEEEVLQTIDAAIFLDPDYIQISYCIPIPGTSLYFDSVEKGYIDQKLSFEKYDSTGQVINTGEVSAERLKDLYYLFWRRFYLRPRFIGREFVRAFGGAHEFTRVMRGTRSFYKRVLSPSRV